MNEQATLSEQLKEQKFVDPSMISSALDFWFNTNSHVRSPFPERIKEKLATDSTAAMLLWSGKLSDAAKKEFNDEMLAERFEEILFETALNTVTEEDEKITIRYPFMPRVGDSLDKKSEEGEVNENILISRRIEKRGDESFLLVDYEDKINGVISTDEFELPE